MLTVSLLVHFLANNRAREKGPRSVTNCRYIPTESNPYGVMAPHLFD